MYADMTMLYCELDGKKDMVPIIGKIKWQFNKK